MKDLLGRRIEPGDLIADIRTNGSGWRELGIVHGGITKGGSVRFLSISGRKTNTKEKCIIKIDQETFDEVYNETINSHRQAIEEYLGPNILGPNIAWRERRINLMETGYEEIMKLKTEIYNK